MGGIAVDRASLLRPENLDGSLFKKLAPLMLGAGAVMCLVTLAVLFMNATADGDELQLARQAAASFHVGFIVCLGFALGSMGFVMIMHQVNASWSAAMRRPLEHAMSLMPLVGIMAIPTVAILTLMSMSSGESVLFHWMEEYATTDPIYQHKEAYLNHTFFLFRAALFFVLWILLVRAVAGPSFKQDETGDRWLTAKARKASSYGLVIFALSSAFASFDWLMGLDYHWFSTMFGVYFFAGFIGATLALWCLILLVLRRAGKLEGVVTVEHFHDLGKLMFGFTVFWGYIGFSQYFLIWYANIPEETMYFETRKTGGWELLTTVLVFGKFVVPFLLLMPRFFRRNTKVLAFAAVWMLAFHVYDIYWLVRPEARPHGGAAPVFEWIDAVGVAGPILVFLGALAWKLGSKPVVPLNDPRLDEALGHKNYV